MKTSKKIILGVVAVVVIGLGFLFFKLFTTQTLEVSAVNLATIEDGIYMGECNNGIISVKVQVEVSDNKITDIELLKHVNGKGQDAEAITDDIVASQSLTVDAISGATLSSSTILKAVENALTK